MVGFFVDLTSLLTVVFLISTGLLTDLVVVFLETAVLEVLFAAGFLDFAVDFFTGFLRVDLVVVAMHKTISHL